jgi:16S rRNA (uracil1498-N3)-methyltransferase
MRLHRFYINKIIDNEKVLIDEERLIHQWRNVFRFNVGGEVILFDGSGFEYDCLIEKITNREASLRIVDKRKGVVPDREIVLYQSLIKKDKMEWVVEKATELGVSKIVPIISERSEKKGFNLERAKKIAIEASEQCGRADVPIVEEIQNLESRIQNMGDNLIVFDSGGEPLKNELEILKKGGDSRTSYPCLAGRQVVSRNSISIFIGPEGGWTPQEIERFKQADAKILSLGNLTLRAETAVIVAISKIQF